MNKNHILGEIQRTARANGGKPLGTQRFAKQTGIRTSDWLGKYWARWGDALKEAGFAPNNLQTALSDREIFEKLIELIREVGRFPVATELRMKARSDPSYPSHNVFERLGSKTQRAKKLRDYCAGKSDFADIIAACDAAIKGNSAAIEEQPHDTSAHYGTVYLIKSGRYFKIGRSNAHGRREYELGIQLPEKVVTIHTIKTDDPVGIESYWHNRFSAKRKNGEWFALDAGDIKAFKRRSFM